MAKKVKYLSDYEEDLIWMSYRYCIGRHTIASTMHAGNIAKHAYGRLSPVRQQFMAYDIRKSIEDVLRIGKANFYIESSISNQDNLNYRPLEMYLDALSENNIKTKEDLKRVKSVRAIYDNRTTKYVVEMLDDDAEDNSEYLLTDIHDLFVWANLAACLDTRNHKMITCVIPETNETIITECFESYLLKSYDGYEFEKCWVPVDRYLYAPTAVLRINSEYITKIENL